MGGANSQPRSPKDKLNNLMRKDSQDMLLRNETTFPKKSFNKIPDRINPLFKNATVVRILRVVKGTLNNVSRMTQATRKQL